MAHSTVPPGLRVIAAVAACPGWCSTSDVATVADCRPRTVLRQVERGFLARHPRLGLVLTRAGRWMLRTCGVVRRQCETCREEFEIEVFGPNPWQRFCGQDCRNHREVTRAAE